MKGVISLENINHSGTMPRISIKEPDKDSQAYRFDLNRTKVLIGRSSSNDIPVEHRSVSKMHCLIRRREGGYMMFDNGSTNGIKHEGERVSGIELTDGMELEIGDVSIVFSLTGEEGDSLSGESQDAEGCD